MGMLLKNVLKGWGRWAAILILLLTATNFGVNNVQAQETDYDLLWMYEADSEVKDVAMSGDGNYIVAGMEDNKVNYFSRDGNLLWSYRTSDSVYGVSVADDGTYIASGTSDNRVYFFNKAGNLLWDYDTGGRITKGVSVSPDGNFIAAGSGDNNVYIFNSAGDLIGSYGSYGLVYDVSVSEQGHYIVSGSWGTNLGWVQFSSNKMYVLSKNGTLLWDYKVATTGICVDITSTGSHIAAGSFKPDNKVYLFNREEELLWSYPIGDQVQSIAISSGGDHVIAGSSEAYMLNRRGEVEWSYNTDNWVNGVAVSSDASYIAIGSGSEVHFFAKTATIATNAITKAEVAISNVKSKGFICTDASSLLLSAENAYDNGDYPKATSLAESAMTTALRIDEQATNAGSLINQARLTISTVKSKGFIVTDAEALLSSAESAFNGGNYEEAESLGQSASVAAEEINLHASEASSSLSKARVAISNENERGFKNKASEELLSQAQDAYDSGIYEQAKELADESYHLAIDVDRDGVANKDDFAPHINNNYIYASASAVFLMIAISTVVLLIIRKRNRKYQELVKIYRIKIEQWEMEGLKGNVLSDFKRRWFE